MDNSVIVVGIGPGSPDYLVPAGKKAIEQARILVGSRRALDEFARCGVETCVIDRDIAGVLAFIEAKSKETAVVVMVSGDPGFFSLMDALRRRMPAEHLQVIPGISSAQMAFARISEPWHGAELISMHGRVASDEELAYRPGKKLGILTDSQHNPAAIARSLLAANWPADTKAWLCTRLSYPDEKLLSLSLGEAAEIQGFEHSVMVVLA